MNELNMNCDGCNGGDCDGCSGKDISIKKLI